MSMLSTLLPAHNGLREGSRFRHLTSDKIRWIDLMTLGAFGFLAATATTWLDFNLRIPGHAILRAIIPLAFGLAMVPRRGSGAVISAASLMTILGYRLAGWGGVGVGALTSLLLTGPLLDVANVRTRRGWQIYLSFAMAGLASNTVAFFVRGVSKSGGGGERALAEWMPSAMVTYPVCGLLAGIISAAICFRISDRRRYVAM
jgi:hypothetical protein